MPGSNPYSTNENRLFPYANKQFYIVRELTYKLFEFRTHLRNQRMAMAKPEALQVLQAMTPEQKLKAAERLYYSAWQLEAAALRAEHPGWTDEAIHRTVRMIFLHARS